MSKVRQWEREIERLEQDLADLEGMEPPGTGGDLNEGRAQRIHDAIAKYREMIANYEGDA